MMVLLIITSTLLSFVLSYAWWTRIRVISLKQDIFDIRDELFDAAHRGAWLTDPMYVEARKQLNVIAGTAELLASGLVLIYVHTRAKKTNAPARLLPATQNMVAKRSVDLAMVKCNQRIAHYVLRETAAGLVLSAILSATPAFRALLTDETERITGSAVRAVDASCLAASSQAAVMH